MTASVEGQWHECVVDSDYEICDQYPYNIRRKGTKFIVNITNHSGGYRQLYLNSQLYLHHRIIALQFIENDDPINKTQVDHIDRDRSNNHISNLRWVTPRDNMNNRNSYRGYNGRDFTYVDEIDESCIVIKTYGKRQLEGYYYDVNLDQFYYEVDGRYKLLNVIQTKAGYELISMQDIEGKRFNLSVNKFKKIHDLE